ncbi:MAG: hypothetical protein K0S01_1323 [Herbinix sp.]|jgi:hypothetical protein|nr:hypothetical protein [Herbinix sp.]
MHTWERKSNTKCAFFISVYQRIEREFIAANEEEKIWIQFVRKYLNMGKRKWII